MRCSVRPMPQATCRQQEINRGFSAPSGKKGGDGFVGLRDWKVGQCVFGAPMSCAKKVSIHADRFLWTVSPSVSSPGAGDSAAGNDGRDLSGSDYPRRSGWLRRTSALSRPRHPDRIFVQPRRHVLVSCKRNLPRPSDEHRSEPFATNRSSRRFAAGLERCRGGRRRRVRGFGGDAGIDWNNPGGERRTRTRHSPSDVSGSDAHQLDGERSRDDCCSQVGKCLGRGPPASCARGRHPE